MQLTFEVTSAAIEISLWNKQYVAGVLWFVALLGKSASKEWLLPPLGQEMSQTKPCFSAAGIKVQRQQQGNQYRATKLLMNDSKRLITLPKTAFPLKLFG